MADFFTAALAFQRAMMQTAFSMASASLKIQSHLLQQQLSLLEAVHDPRRKDDLFGRPISLQDKGGGNRKTGKKASPCHGPDLMDHYGKRAHDIDVEHLR